MANFRKMKSTEFSIRHRIGGEHMLPVIRENSGIQKETTKSTRTFHQSKEDSRFLFGCDCGKYLEEKEVEVDHILAKAMVCSSCGFITLTKVQAVEFRKRVEFHQVVDQERKVIQIGNSFGITFPEKLREFGVSVGSTVKIEALNEKSFKVEIA